MADLSPQLWRRAKIDEIRIESPRTKTFRLSVDGLYPFIAGQHFSIQLKAPNGYSVARYYSFSSAPSTDVIETTIVHAPHGEVSGWFNESAEVGDEIEISPPIGYYFNWTQAQTEPILLIGGGVGVTPLMSMLRERRMQHSEAPIALFYSARNYDDICFKDELFGASQPGEELAFTLVESVPEDWQGHNGLVSASMLKPLLKPNQTIYVCGPTGFVETVDTILTDQLAVPMQQVKTERFG